MAEARKRSQRRGRSTARKSGSAARKSGSTARGGSTKRSAGSRGGAKRTTASRGGARKRSPGGTAARRRSTAARGGAQARGRRQTARKAAGQAAATATGPAGALGFSVAEFRDALARGLIGPLNLLLLTRERIEDAVNDAIRRGRVTADDGQELVQTIVARGRKETNDVLSDLEQLLGRGRSEVGGATAKARTRAVRSAEPMLAQADRARRAAGIPPAFPILGYDELTTAQVESRLQDLTPAQLRKVRDYEKRHGNRKTVLNAVNAKLG